MLAKSSEGLGPGRAPAPPGPEGSDDRNGYRCPSVGQQGFDQGQRLGGRPFARFEGRGGLGLLLDDDFQPFRGCPRLQREALAGELRVACRRDSQLDAERPGVGILEQ